jgi:hypothetical protein
LTWRIVKSTSVVSFAKRAGGKEKIRRERRIIVLAILFINTPLKSCDPASPVSSLEPYPRK